MFFSYLSFSASHQIFKLHYFIIDGGAVALLDSVVRRALFPFVWIPQWLPSDGDAVDGQLLGVHHHRHCCQYSAPTHKGLTHEIEDCCLKHRHL